VKASPGAMSSPRDTPGAAAGSPRVRVVASAAGAGAGLPPLSPRVQGPPTAAKITVCEFIGARSVRAPLESKKIIILPLRYCSAVLRLAGGNVLEYSLWGEVTVSLYPPAPAEQDIIVFYKLKGSPMMGSVTTNKKVVVDTGVASMISLQLPSCYTCGR